MGGENRLLQARHGGQYDRYGYKASESRIFYRWAK